MTAKTDEGKRSLEAQGGWVGSGETVSGDSQVGWWESEKSYSNTIINISTQKTRKHIPFLEYKLQEVKHNIWAIRNMVTGHQGGGPPGRGPNSMYKARDVRAKPRRAQV